MRNGKDAIIIGAVTVASLGCFLTGCGGLRWGFLQGQQSEPAAQPTAEATPDYAQPLDGDDDDMLVKVEEFLARTEGYRMPDASATTEPDADRLGTTASGTQAQGAATKASAPDGEQPGRQDGPRQAVANTQIGIDDSYAAAPPLAVPVIESVSIRTPTPAAPPAEASTAANTTNKALDITVGDEPVTVDRILAHLSTLAEKNGDIESVWRLRLAQLAFDRQPAPLAASTALPADARRVLDALSGVIGAARRLARNPVSDGTEALNESERLVQVLSDRADPTVPTVELCRKVVTFGVYEKMPPEAFLAGRSVQAIVYTEIGNFRSEVTAEGQYRTMVGTRLEIMTADGQSVWQREEPEIVDTCRRQRRDFFIAQRITLPPTLAAGDYVLKVLAEDRLSGKATETVLPFTIHSPTSVATRG